MFCLSYTPGHTTCTVIASTDQKIAGGDVESLFQGIEVYIGKGKGLSYEIGKLVDGVNHALPTKGPSALAFNVATSLQSSPRRLSPLAPARFPLPLPPLCPPLPLGRVSSSSRGLDKFGAPNTGSWSRSFVHSELLTARLWPTDAIVRTATSENYEARINRSHR